MKALKWQQIKISVATIAGLFLTLILAVGLTACGGDKKKNDRYRRGYDFRNNGRSGGGYMGCQYCSFDGQVIRTALGKSVMPLNGMQLGLEFFGDAWSSGGGDPYGMSGYSGPVAAEGVLIVDQSSNFYCEIPPGVYFVRTVTEGLWQGNQFSNLRLEAEGVDGYSGGAFLGITLYNGGTLPGPVYDFDGYSYQYSFYADVMFDVPWCPPGPMGGQYYSFM